MATRAMNGTQARQGDLLIIKVDKLPTSGLKVKKDPVLAYGEVTGHCHKVETPNFDQVDLFVDEEGNIFVETKTDIDVWHNKHDAVHCDPGIYKVVRQREYNPLAAQRERKVVD